MKITKAQLDILHRTAGGRLPGDPPVKITETQIDALRKIAAECEKFTCGTLRPKGTRADTISCLRYLGLIERRWVRPGSFELITVTPLGKDFLAGGDA